MNSDLLNQTKDQVTVDQGVRKIVSCKEIVGYSVYKSTLVSQLNGDVFPSKDRLARIKHIIQFNYHDDCLQARSLGGSNMLRIWSNYEVHFV